MSHQWNRAWKGIALANSIALGVVCLSTLLAKWVDPTPYGATYIFSVFTLVPVLMGFVLELFRVDPDMPQTEKVSSSLLNLGVAFVLCMVVLREGTLCLLMASPLVLLFHTLGVFLGNRIAKLRNGRLNVSIAPMIIFIIAIDAISPHSFHNSEADRVLIRARPEVVWKYIVAYPANHSPVDFWLWRIGLPAPVQSTATSNEVGATRLCQFTGGIDVKEKITDLQRGRRLAFDVTRQPDHPEVIGHFVLERGEFRLIDNGDGTTTLIGTSWYHLNVYPSQYYDLWVQEIVKQVHIRVMQHIRRLAEQDATENDVARD